MKTYLKNTILLILLIIIDQIIKYFFQATKSFLDLGIIAFHYVRNTGASFGILQGNNVLLAWFSLIVLGIIMMNVDKIRKEYELPVLLVVAGLLSNLIDRVFRGFVIDFIDLKWWPVFNIADSLIVVGVIWLIIVIIKDDLKKEKPVRRVRTKI